MSSALVTGGAGFIGSHLTERLLKEDFEVICLDNFNDYYDPEIKRNNVRPFLRKRNFKLVEGDIRDKDLVRKIINENSVDYVFHEAAQAGIRISVDNPAGTHEINATGSLNVLNACLDSNVKKFINASSSSVYGKAITLPFTEDSPNLPVSPYGVTKLAVEHYCRVFQEVYGLKTISLRYFTVYGPRMRPDLAISIFTKKALNNEPLVIFGSGEKTRDFTYIDDIVDATIKAMDKGFGEYNIGSGNRISINELAENIIKITKSSSKIVHTESQKGDAEHTWADVGKAKKELDWQPTIDINEGLNRFVQWYKNERP
ncbi:UDP-glucose 4-epimerase [Candidatus Altiarchaeales archaeon WOR_SM1_SCG]|nr:UDP-glucose 4-epimerase [Candidatus Altiarchaeales archaeon WOR_SM1_SCG]